MFLSTESNCLWIHETKNCTSSLNIGGTIKNDSAGCGDQLCLLWLWIAPLYMFPSMTMWEVQSTIDITMGELLAHMSRMFMSGVHLMVTPSSSKPRPNVSESWSKLEIFLSYVTWNLNLTFHLVDIREIEKVFKNDRATHHLAFSFLGSLKSLPVSHAC